MEQGTLPRIHNSRYWPDLTTYGPKMICEMYPTKGNDPLDCQSVLSVTIRKPQELQEFYLWDPNQVAIDIKVKVKQLPFSAAFSLNIFYPDLQDSKKTYALVDNIKLPKIGRKGLQRGDIIISIKERKLENETYEGLQQIVHQLNLQKQIKLIIQRRQWRQNDYLTSLAIDSPANLDWRPLQAELQKKHLKEPLGFKFVFAKNQLEQPCPIIKQIAAGETPAAKCPYLTPGCKITAVNKHPVKGLSFEGMKTMLQKAQRSVLLSIEEPTGLLQEKHLPSSGERYTWPGEKEKGILTISQSEAQISFSNSSLADGVQTVNLCQQVKGASKTVNDAKHEVSPDHERLVNCLTQQMPPDCRSGYSEADRRPSAPTVKVPDKAQSTPICQKCVEISKTDKQKQTIQDIPVKIYHTVCQRMDIESPSCNDHRIFGEKLGFSRNEIFAPNNQPTDCLLRVWSERKGKNATVEKIMNILDDMERHDILELLQVWVESKYCSKCFKAFQQAHERESCV
ncbi:hypothetical protein AWC38_SpisGene22733 [Stylophora pistillata]|uniref:PDZ domain-containing protein n=2 Tax=Stylophora pistillata TaxID=50429 RepID=A0A2B4R7R5_STYPI|nr:hypothetical protein AWC38_SpisGene22733 [Stylophora pistillata]